MCFLFLYLFWFFFLNFFLSVFFQFINKIIRWYSRNELCIFLLCFWIYSSMYDTIVLINLWQISILYFIYCNMCGLVIALMECYCRLLFFFQLCILLLKFCFHWWILLYWTDVYLLLSTRNRTQCHYSY